MAQNTTLDTRRFFDRIGIYRTRKSGRASSAWLRDKSISSGSPTGEGIQNQLSPVSHPLHQKKPRISFPTGVSSLIL
jgi:hypothetical protein